MRYRFLAVILIWFGLVGQGGALTEITGGWNAAVDGGGTSYGESTLMGCSGDPLVTLGITSTSSLYGPGSIFDKKVGSQSLTLPLGGYELSVAYDGEVSSSLTLTSAGSGSMTGYIRSVAAGASTGEGSYDLSGSADIMTEGYLSGSGLGTASSEGMAEYGAKKAGTPSEAWGKVFGSSSLKIEGVASDSLVSTGGQPNGLHTESRSTKKTINGEVRASSSSWMAADAGVINEGKANVSTSGTAQGGSWDSNFVGIKEKLSNENVASSVTGDITGYTEANGHSDASRISSIMQSEATKDGRYMQVYGGPATYAAATQSSNAQRTYSETWIKNSIWGSVARDQSNQTTVVQWGNLSDLGSGAHTYEAGSNALSFGKILMTTSYQVQGGQAISSGNFSLDTYAEATKGKRAISGTQLGPEGDGTISSNDEFMQNTAGFTGGLDHFSMVDAGGDPFPIAETRAILTRAFVSTEPGGIESLAQPFRVTTIQDPNVAWSRTDGYYYQAH